MGLSCEIRENSEGMKIEVNDEIASAREILTGALHDNGRAIHGMLNPKMAQVSRNKLYLMLLTFVAIAVNSRKRKSTLIVPQHICSVLGVTAEGCGAPDGSALFVTVAKYITGTQ
ncbi:hypothetical protein RHSIM_RhsimUnG0250100 [Rhododendron simsii]|uniref:Uncharacterized protein n=1 Tax=Rhododendron simsii TaxID=118357 RepID=A0A834FTD4_RHOSS|nr:hypothetical protein RHSIM_RhsimUnG0250100 [Rhododendron simsii]